MAELCRPRVVLAARASQLGGWRWACETACPRDKPGVLEYGSVDNLPLIRILVYKIVVTTGF